MVAILLYYLKFTKSLTIIGFEINLYDLCVANKVIDVSQMTKFFQVDYCNLSHRERNFNDHMIKWLHQEYESIFKDSSRKMSVSRGKVHDYIVMTLDYTVHSQVNIMMLNYI